MPSIRSLRSPHAHDPAYHPLCDPVAGRIWPEETTVAPCPPLKPRPSRIYLAVVPIPTRASA